MIQQKLQERKLPELMKSNDGTPICIQEQWMKHRAELLESLSREIYGFTPAPPSAVSAEITEHRDALAGKAVWDSIQLSFDTPNGTFSFPFVLVLPAVKEKVPVFLSISFRKDIPDLYLPAEEIIDHGYGFAMFCSAGSASP